MGAWEHGEWEHGSMGAWEQRLNYAGSLAARRQLHGQLPGAKTAKSSSMVKWEKGLHARRAYSKAK